MIDFEDHRAGAAAGGAHKGLVDLDGVEREPLQIGQRRMAGAEIIQRQSGTEFADAGEHLRACSGFSITSDSVNSSFSVPRPRPTSATARS